MLSSNLLLAKREWFHISKIAKERINRVEDVLTLGDKVKGCLPWQGQDGKNQLLYEGCKRGLINIR